MEKNKTFLLTVLLLMLCRIGYAHPTGNMIVVGDYILWSYIDPLDDPDHHACIMIRDANSEPKVFLKSEFPASDYMLFNKGKSIYAVERKYINATDSFWVRVLKLDLAGSSTVLWDWFQSDYRIGEGGFLMLSDSEMIFCDYPDVYRLKEGEEPRQDLKLPNPVKRIRAIDNDQILLLGDDFCALASMDGVISKKWEGLIDNGIQNAPLGRNQIFEADYFDGALLLAYWGNRSFDIIAKDGTRKTIRSQIEPLVPHWVAFWNNKKLLFSSRLTFDGKNPQPYFVVLDEKTDQKVLWGKN